MAEGVRYQNLRDFTVQIRKANGAIVGTGIAVSMDGKIVTCRHVVEAAVGQAIDGVEVGVYFPQARGGEEKNRQAVVAKFFPEHDDDVVLLQLTGGVSPLAPEQIAVLGTAEFSEGHPFRTYGYSPIGNYPASRGEGTILGTIEPPLNANLQVDPVQLKSRDIAAGMSGAAVLDVVRNHVVGLVAERYYPKDVVQDEFGYALDSKVLTFPPFEFMLQGEALALKPAPELRLDQDWRIQASEIASYALAHRKTDEKYAWNGAPAVLPEWTGRDDLLAALTVAWNDPQKRVAGLIGFGGEGKSSLARKWVDSICRGEALLRPDNAPEGVFWWGFYENRSVDEFLEAALKYLGGGRIDPKAVPSSSLRAQIVGAMLGAGRCLFVLDGLEVLQHADGDQYGLLQNNDLRDLLTYFARPEQASFCLVTSRAPLLDLLDYTTYSHQDVDRLSDADGVALLEKLGVKGSQEQKAQVVADWGGHALTLSILAAILVEQHGGEIAHLADLPTPSADEPRYQRVHRVLRRYDEHLTETEREFLKLFSAFRTPVSAAAFEKVFAPLLPASPIAKSPNHEITPLVARLVHYRLLRHDPQADTYTTHPLIRNHYFAIFTKGDPAQEKAAHVQIKDYYLSIAGDTPTYPTLDDLKPLIEVVHHACQAGAYDDAWKIYWERIAQMKRFVVVHQLGAYETDLALITEFFPDGDREKEPQVTEIGNKRWILNAVGFRLMSLGRLREAVPFYERKNELYEKTSIGYHNLADLHAALGALEQSAASATQALVLARKADDKGDEKTSLKWQAWVAHLLGDLQTASEAFAQAEKLEQEINPSIRYLYSVRGIQHAEHLHRSGEADYARRVARANLEICEQYHWPDDISRCHRVLGDLDSDSGQFESARAHYDQALRIARGISYRPALIEALLARGRFLAKTGNANDAFNNLNEALAYALKSGYRIYDADLRVALGWALLAIGEKHKAKQEAERALEMSREMKYHWGQVDAREVLGVMENGE